VIAFPRVFSESTVSEQLLQEDVEDEEEVVEELVVEEEDDVVLEELVVEEDDDEELEEDEWVLELDDEELDVVLDEEELEDDELLEELEELEEEEELLEDDELLEELLEELDEEEEDEEELEELEEEDELLDDEVVVGVNWYVSPPQKDVLPVVATIVLPVLLDVDDVDFEEEELLADPPDRISSVPGRGMLYWAMSRFTVAGELPVFVALARTVAPETISAVSPPGTFWTDTVFVSVS
jgi:hypothetical protein